MAPRAKVSAADPEQAGEPAEPGADADDGAGPDEPPARRTECWRRSRRRWPAATAVGLVEGEAERLHLLEQRLDRGVQPAEVLGVAGVDRQLDGVAGDGLVEPGVEQAQPVAGVVDDRGRAVRRWPAGRAAPRAVLRLGSLVGLRRLRLEPAGARPRPGRCRSGGARPPGAGPAGDPAGLVDAALPAARRSPSAGPQRPGGDRADGLVGSGLGLQRGRHGGPPRLPQRERVDAPPARGRRLRDGGHRCGAPMRQATTASDEGYGEAPDGRRRIPTAAPAPVARIAAGAMPGHHCVTCEQRPHGSEVGDHGGEDPVDRGRVARRCRARRWTPRRSPAGVRGRRRRRRRSGRRAPARRGLPSLPSLSAVEQARRAAARRPPRPRRRSRRR